MRYSFFNNIKKGMVVAHMENKHLNVTGMIATALVTSVISMPAAHAKISSQLTSVTSNIISPSQTEIRMQFKGVPVMPRAYQTENPNRLILDLQGTQNVMSNRNLSFDTKQVGNIVAVNNDKLTRLVINLKSHSNFSTRVEGNTLVLKVADGSKMPTKKRQISAKSQPTTGSIAKSYDQRISNPLLNPKVAVANARKFALKGLNRVNFRKTDGNTGRIDIALANADIPVDVQRKGSKLVVRMLGAKVPKHLRKRMSVKSFGTPVKNIDAFNDGNNGTIIIQPDTEFDYQVYQADSNLTVEVNPIVRVTDPRPKEKVYSGKPLSMDFQDVEVRAVLQLIADFTDLNLVASDNVNGRMTLRLQNVPWDQALDIIMKSRSLDMRKNGNVVMIAPASDIAAQEKKEIESKQQIKELAQLQTEYIQLNYAKAENMKALIGQRGSTKFGNSLLSERGAVTIDKRTNTLIIQDTADKIDEIRGLISKLDIPVRQVMIEARIVTASDSFDEELGVKWGVLSNGAATNRSLLVGASEQTLWDLKKYTVNTTEINGKQVSTPSYTIERPSNLNVDLGVASGGASKIAFGLLELSNVMLDLELSALQADGRGEVVSTPKVLTADKQKAVVAAGSQIPYQQATASGATAVSFINAELRLEVTPSITPDGRVAMQLKINSDSPGKVQANGIRAIDTNRVDTNVLVDDGQTVVLGGIFQNQSTNRVTKTPFLGDLPYVGRLFRRTVSNNSKQELLIFVTPRLVDDNVSNVGR